MAAALNIRDIGDDLKEALRRRAAEDGRSMSDTVKAILERELGVRKPIRQFGTLEGMFPKEFLDDLIDPLPEALEAGRRLAETDEW